MHVRPASECDAVHTFAGRARRQRARLWAACRGVLGRCVDVRFADLPQIEGPTGRFMLQQMAAVAELEAGMISSRTKVALAAAKARGTKLGGNRGAKLSAKLAPPAELW
jgi:DNA invertase Pin-like site-specific DNA recombinase